MEDLATQGDFEKDIDEMFKASTPLARERIVAFGLFLGGSVSPPVDAIRGRAKMP